MSEVSESVCLSLTTAYSTDSLTALLFDSKVEI